MPRKSLPLAEKIKSLTIEDQATGCWIWQGAVNNYGYAMVSFVKADGARTTTTASRASYMASVGDVPDHMHVCHRCDNPLCANPAHLFLGTRQDNINDMMAKGRGNRDHDGRGARYTNEFKAKASNFAGTVEEASKALGIPIVTLTRWRRRYRPLA